MTESVVLMKWCEKNGFGPFVLTGLSMGGHVLTPLSLHKHSLTNHFVCFIKDGVFIVDSLAQAGGSRTVFELDNSRDRVYPRRVEQSDRVGKARRGLQSEP